MTDEPHVEIPAQQARAGRRGVHVFVIWAVSTAAVAICLFALFALSAASG